MLKTNARFGAPQELAKPMTHYERVGGEAGLRPVIEDFYNRVFDDVMIGYLFRGRDRGRLVELEVQFTARALGAETVYEGRGMRQAHAGLGLQTGQFDRRHRILTETLAAHRVDPEVVEAWLGHSRALRRAVLAGGGETSHCAAPSEKGAGGT